MASKSVHKGQVQVFVGNVTRMIGTIYPNPYAALKEAPENSRDAGARDIYIYISEKEYIIQDNGHGLVPFMTTKGREIVDLYRENTELQTATDIRKRLDQRTLHSMEWMMECIGFSAKDPDDPKAYGMLGIGAWAIYQNGTRASMRSRPSAQLSGIANAPVAELIFPELGKTGYEIRENVGELNDYLGYPIDGHGTVLRVSGLREVIKPARLVNVLIGAFQDDALERAPSEQYRITVIDNVTGEGKRERGGKRLAVTFAQRYPGSSLYSNQFKIGQGLEFNVLLHYTPTGEGTEVKIRRKKSYVPISQFPVLNIPPYNYPGMSGYFQFPHVPGEEGVLIANPTKTFPLGSPITQEWIKILVDLAPTINELVEKRRDRSRSSKLQNRAKSMEPIAETALKTAVQDTMKALEHETLGGAKRRKAQEHEDHGPIKATGGRTLVKVLNEVNKPVSDIVVAVMYYENDELIEERTVVSASDKSGFIDFGELQLCDPDHDGYYIVEMQDDQGAFINPKKFYSLPKWARRRFKINLTEETPGYEILFRINTGHTVVKVLNELNKGVGNAYVRISRCLNGHPIPNKFDEVATRSTGQFDLGELDFNKNEGDFYRAELLTDKGVFATGKAKLVGESDHVFDFRITTEQPGMNVIFHIQTESDPPIRDMGKLKISFAPHENEKKPWINRLNVGYVQINTAHPVVEEVLIQGEDHILAALVADYASAAVIEELLSKDAFDPSELHDLRSVLFTKMILNMEALLTKDKEKRKTRQ